MKKLNLLFILFVLATAACGIIEPDVPPTLPADAALPGTPVPTQTPLPPTPTLEPPTPTPEIFIALTQAIPGEFQPTEPAANAGTTVTYAPLTVTLPDSIANGASGMNFPRLDGEDAAWWEKTPGHLQLNLADYYVLQGKTHQPVLYVYPAAAYAELVPAAFESMHRLNNYLYAPNTTPAPAELPGAPFFNAQMLFSAQILPVSFQNGSGIRYITEYAQYPAPANNTDLIYTYIGLTGDGAYYIIAILPLTSPVLAETSAADAPLPAGGLPYPFASDPAAPMDVYYTGVTELLNNQPATSFTPSLAALDALIQSISVVP